MIPKTIHYCWFGKNEYPDIMKKCLILFTAAVLLASGSFFLNPARAEDEEDLLIEEVIEEVVTEKNNSGKLTQELVDMFINTVYVHDEDRLEIEYTFDDIMDRAKERFEDSVC